jgi:hypothetical protein
MRGSNSEEPASVTLLLRRRLPGLVLFLSLLATACSGGGQGPAATPTPTPKDRLDAAGTQMAQLRAFHFLLTHQNGYSTLENGLQMTRADGDFLQPDRLRATVNAGFQGLPVMVSIIAIGDQSWITNPLQSGQHYQPLPNGPQTAEILNPNTGLLAAARDMQNPRLTGSEKIANVDCYVISGTVDAGSLRPIAGDAEAGRQVPAQVWIGKQDSLVYRVRLNGPLSASEPKNIVRQVDLSQFNESITIEPPSS